MHRPDLDVPGYRVHSLLGEGETAVVYEADSEALGGRVALKLLDPRLNTDPEFISRLRQEVRSTSQLQHPNIGRLYACGGYRDSCYLAMERVDGVSLGSLLERGPVSPERAAEITQQIAAGLDEAHQRGVLHRDLKPSNVLIDCDGRVVLTDFGLIRAIRLAALTIPRVTTRRAPYLAPEVCAGQAADHRADIYSLGIILFEMLTGRPPFEDSEPMAIYARHLNQPPPKCWEVRPGLPKRFQRVLDRALDKDPARRYQHAGDLAADFQAALEDQLNAQSHLPSRTGPTLESIARSAREATASLFRSGAGKVRRPESVQPSPILENGATRAALDAPAAATPTEAAELAELHSRLEGELATARAEREKLELEAAIARESELAARLRREIEESETRRQSDASASAREEQAAREREAREAEIRAELERVSRAAAEEAAREAAREAAIRVAQAAAEREAQEREARAHEDRQRRQEEEAARLRAEQEARREREQLARERSELEARLEAERQAREQAEREAREQAARLEAERQARETAERDSREQADLTARLEAERRAREVAEREARDQAERARQLLEEQARQAAEREAQLQLERETRERLEREAQEARRLREEADRERQAREAAEREARELREQETRRRMEREIREHAEREIREQIARDNQERAEREARERAETESRKEAERAARELAERIRIETEAREKSERAEAEKAAVERRAREAALAAEQEAKRAAEKREAEREARARAEREARERAEQEARERSDRAARRRSEKQSRHREIELRGRRKREAEAGSRPPAPIQAAAPAPRRPDSEPRTDSRRGILVTGGVAALAVVVGVAGLNWINRPSGTAAVRTPGLSAGRPAPVTPPILNPQPTPPTTTAWDEKKVRERLRAYGEAFVRYDRQRKNLASAQRRERLAALSQALRQIREQGRDVLDQSPTLLSQVAREQGTLAWYAYQPAQAREFWKRAVTLDRKNQLAAEWLKATQGAVLKQ